jgi:hypothetical protein|tara:strand:- start:388 stop:723 length:336 start_codon:yes stop_codon:yes gene_type:complete
LLLKDLALAFLEHPDSRFRRCPAVDDRIAQRLIPAVDPTSTASNQPGQGSAGRSTVPGMMLSIKMNVIAFTQDALKIIQAADIYGVALGVHPGSTKYMDAANLTKAVSRLF